MGISVKDKHKKYENEMLSRSEKIGLLPWHRASVAPP